MGLRIEDIVDHLSKYTIRRHNGLPALYLHHVKGECSDRDFSVLLHSRFTAQDGTEKYLAVRLDIADTFTYRFLRTLRGDLKSASYMADKELWYGK